MVAISLKLPDDLAQQSRVVADRIGVTRTELIRQALRHELDAIEARLERAAMARALEAMRGDAGYTQESETLIEGVTEPLPEEPEEWWKG